MTKLSPEAQALLDQGRSALTPDAATKARVLQSLDASLAASGGAAAGAGTLAVGKVWLVLALMAGIGGGWLLFRDRGGGEPTETAGIATEVAATEVAATEVVATQVVATAPAPQEPSELEAAEVEAPAAQVEAPAAQVEAPTPPPSKKIPKPRPSPADQVRLERELIAEAQRAIRAGDFARARKQLRTHNREFANGLLSPERQAATAIVECLDPQAANGKAVARRFLQAHPSSPLAPRVRASCDLP